MRIETYGEVNVINNGLGRVRISGAIRHLPPNRVVFSPEEAIDAIRAGEKRFIINNRDRSSLIGAIFKNFPVEE